MKSSNLESLLKKAAEFEKNYEWLQASEYYEKAFTQTFKGNDFLKAADLQEKMGFCYFRAALQAQQPEQNKLRMKQAIKAYNAAVGFLEQIRAQGNLERVIHNKGWVLFLRSWLESDLSEKKRLLDEWWRFESDNFNIYDKINDPLSIGKIYNDILEISATERFFFTRDNVELIKITEQGIDLGEKAIKLLSKENNVSELAKAYCWTSWYYGFIPRYRLIENKRDEFGKKGVDYSRKAIELSLRTDDAWLIGWSNNAASHNEANLELSIKFIEDFIKQGKNAKDNYMLSVGLMEKGNRLRTRSIAIEDPDKKRESLKTALKTYEQAKTCSDLANFFVIRLMSRNKIINMLYALVSYEANLESRKTLLERIVRMAKENLELAPEWFQYSSYTFSYLSIALLKLSRTLTEINDKRQNLLEALKYTDKGITIRKRFLPFEHLGNSRYYMRRARIQVELAKLEENKEKKIRLLEDAISSMKTNLNLLEKGLSDSSQEWVITLHGYQQYQSGRILCQLYSLTKNEALLTRAIEVYDKAIENYNNVKHYSNLAEAYWQKAQIKDQQGEQLKSSKNYELASNAYINASEKLPKLKDFYINHSVYMKAWNEIEQAKYYHTREDYPKAKINYEKAGKLHEELDNWNYLSPNYFAWAKIEQAEELSRTEKPQEAIQNFQDAFEYFKKAESNIKIRINENPSSEEKDLITKILKASDLRKRYCQARISLEEAKILDRKGEYDLSSKNYGEAAQNIESIIEEIESEDERKELRLIEVLCRAWQKMALAEETASSESYVEAANFFEQAKDLAVTKKSSLWTLGNSSFCRGLAAGTKYQSSLSLKDHAKAKGRIKSAATSYLRAGFKNASEYAKATLRLFDAYLFINQAETEADQEKRAKQYQMAENLLKISAGSFVKAKQPEKTAQVQQILENVREEKTLAISLNQVMQAPTIASTTLSFAAPTPTSEVSVGLGSFEHANVQANLISGVKEVRVRESFCLSVEFVNAGKEPALLTKVEEIVPSDFVVVKKPEIYRLEDTTLNMKGKQLAPLKLVEAKLVLQPSRKGVYQLRPRVHYLDELGQNKSLQPKPVEIKVEEVVLADRVSTGTKELDSLLLGGIPEEYAVVLTGPPSDERESIVKSFLEAGVKQDQITFHATTEPTGLVDLLEKHQSTFFLFLCNPKPKVEVPDLPNIYKLRSKTDLNNLNIALTVASRSLDQKLQGHKRVCVEIVSDVLIRHQVEVTRRWISGLIADMGSKGFTLLAVMDPSSHPHDQANAILNLFDGTISLFETETAIECKTSIQIKRLRNQDYIKNPICLSNPT